MTKREAAWRLRELARVIDETMGEDEEDSAVPMWVRELHTIANWLQPAASNQETREGE